MKFGAPYHPPGFDVCPPPPPDAQQMSEPQDMGDGWSQILFVDQKTGIHYLEFYNENNFEWLWVCGIPGQAFSPDYIDMTNIAWVQGKKKTALWAGLGALAGVAGGVVVATQLRGDKRVYGALGAGLGAAAGALILNLAVRPSQFPQTAGFGLIDVQRYRR